MTKGGKKMAKWMGWLAALGGLVAILDKFVPGMYLLYIGGIVAIVFGAWSALAK